MTLPRVFGELTPAAYREVIDAVRAKYDIPDPSPDGYPFPDILAADIPFDEVREQIYEHIRRLLPEELPIPPQIRPLLQLPAELPLAEALRALAELTPRDRTWGNTVHPYLGRLLEPHARKLADMLFLYVMEGKTTPAPDTWFGGVFSLKLSEEMVIVALASQYSDLEELIAKFRKKYKDKFPKRRRRLDPTATHAAASLRLRLEGYKLKDISDIYIAAHPDKFPADPLSPRYRAAKKQLEQRIKKQMTRLQAVLREMGDT